MATGKDNVFLSVPMERTLRDRIDNLARGETADGVPRAQMARILILEALYHRSHADPPGRPVASSTNPSWGVA